MKKLLLVLVCAIVVLVVDGCNSGSTGVGGSGSSTAYVRFQNTILDGGSPWNLGYGVRAGSAEYDGQLNFGNATPYYSIAPGTYALQMKASTGAWLTVTNSVKVTGTTGHWSVVMAGDWSTTVTFTLVQDY
jgi:hypothetical protein